MKKTYKSIMAFIVLLSLVTLKTGAQISGTVTVDSGTPTGGTNYQTFTALAASLTTGGVSGPVVVNVIGGPFNEQPVFNNIPGVSATNTITINGNGCTISFASTSNITPYTLNLNGADRMNWYNLNVHGLGTTYAWALCLSAGADYNTFTACTFSCPVNGTGFSQYPVITSGINSGISYANSANYTMFDNCMMLNGYYGAYLIGLTSTPYQVSNVLKNCTVRDWNYMGIYCYFQKNPILKSNTIDRLTRTTVGSSLIYGMYVYFCQGAMVDGNRVQRIFENMQTATTTLYGMFIAYNSQPGTNLNTAKNNIVCDIKSNGTVYGMQGYYWDGYIYHNTVSLDHTTSTATGLSVGIYMYATGGYYVWLRDNLVTITRGGTGTKYGYWGGGVTGNMTINNNNYYVNAPGGTNYVGWYTSGATSLAALQAQGIEANGTTVDPVYTGLPNNLIPTATAFNNLGAGVGVSNDYSDFPRDGSTPDIGAHEFLSVQCAGTPSANTLVTPTAPICPNNSVNLTLANYYSDLGITYQWQTSTTSTVGPFTAITGATTQAYTTPSLNVTTYYNVIMTCANGGGSITPAGVITIAGTSFSTVPYYESFEQIAGTNKLPNCSWLVPNIGSNALTYTASNTNGRMPRTGTNFASFYYSPAGTYYYYTNGIQLNAGITYSASLWYMTEYVGYNNWSDLSILLNTTQTAVGAQTIVSSGGPAISNIYKSLSNTFTVASSGTYYVAVKAQVTTSSFAQYLSWDDLSIIIPCQVNAPVITANANQAVVCSGDPVVLTAGGANSYTWSNSVGNTNVVTVNPLASVPTTISYMVMGTNTLSGCNSSALATITVNPKPSIMIYASSPSVCAGSPVMLTAFGANTFTWNSGAQSAGVSVSPLINTSYTVIGSNTYGCNSDANVAILAKGLPNIGVSSSQPNTMCVGEIQTITATGAVTYQWYSSTSAVVMQGSAVGVSPSSTTQYTVIGTDASGCVNKNTFIQNVDECVGLREQSVSNGVRVFPNPTAGLFTVHFNNNSTKAIEVLDLNGRVISTSTSSALSVNVNIAHLSNGVYYVKIQSTDSVEVIKVVKQ